MGCLQEGRVSVFPCCSSRQPTGLQPKHDPYRAQTAVQEVPPRSSQRPGAAAQDDASRLRLAAKTDNGKSLRKILHRLSVIWLQCAAAINMTYIDSFLFSFFFSRNSNKLINYSQLSRVVVTCFIVRDLHAKSKQENMA